MCISTIKEIEQKAWELTEKKDFLQAEKKYKECINIILNQINNDNNDIINYWFGAGYAMLMQEKINDSLEYFFVAHVLNDKDNLSVVYNLAFVLNMLGNHNLAIYYFDKALKIISSDNLNISEDILLSIYYLKSISLIKLNRFNDALTLLNLAIQKKEDKLFFFERGKIYYFQKQYTYALNDLSKALNLGLTSLELNNLIQKVILSLKNEEEKSNSLKKSIKDMQK